MNRPTMTLEGKTNMPRTVAVLPQEEQDMLRKIRDAGDLDVLRERVYALRQARWPLRAIGDPLDAPRSTVRMWEYGYKPSPDATLPDVPEAPRSSRELGERVVRWRMDVPHSERDKIRDLAVEARAVRGRTPKDAPARVAADELDKMIEEYIDHDVPVKRIATHMDVTARAVAARHERYVLRQEDGS